MNTQTEPRPFTLLSTDKTDDPVLRQILDQDMANKNSPLELMKEYATQINKSTAYGDLAVKLDRLFTLGIPPEDLDGYYHGVTLGLKTGLDGFAKLEGFLKKFGLKQADPMQMFYGRILSSSSPWAGKNFAPISAEKLDHFTDGQASGDGYMLGINSFRQDDGKIVNNIAGYALTAIMDMKKAPPPEGIQRSWISQKGGMFLARKAASIDPDNPGKQVVALNYRWKKLGNRFPNDLLVDEIVYIADGLLLGKLFYATTLQRIGKDYDPSAPDKDYEYRDFGYFLLMDDSWVQEKNRLWPELTDDISTDLPERFRTFTLTDPQKASSLEQNLGAGKTVLHYLRDLSNGVAEGGDREKKSFTALKELFSLGQRPEGINGYFNGGVVAFQSSGFFKIFEPLNILNKLWPIARPFSPWTGKSFTPTTVEGAARYIGADAAYYNDKGQVFVGANTYSERLDPSLPAAIFVENVDKIGMVVEKPNENEKAHGVGVKSFYFIACFAPSINPQTSTAEVLQFNYRWPSFHTMPPDFLCIDELVRISDGLYLGQLLYSTEPSLPFDPARAPADYKYENFGFFMLMDDQWQGIRNFIEFDVDTSFLQL
ncbi:MAG: hypothetical protein OEZ55_01025 [Nitrospinota bacterium]|nr:hypothetical protein [Nitrospinota bacterium]